MRELYVYYRVASSQGDAAHAAVQRLQAGMRARYGGLQARLLRRPGEVDGLQTWMEIYALADTPGGVSGPMQAEIERAAELIACWIQGPRHVEWFEPL